MKAAAIGLLAVACTLTGCTQKSEADKCVEVWEASVKHIPDDDKKRFEFMGDKKTKAEARYQERLNCMYAAGENNE